MLIKRTLRKTYFHHDETFTLAGLRTCLINLPRLFIPLHSQFILWHDKLFSHLTAFPLILPGLDLSNVNHSGIQMVLLLLLLRNNKITALKLKSFNSGVTNANVFGHCDSCAVVCLTLCLRLSFMMSLVSCSIFSFHRSKK